MHDPFLPIFEDYYGTTLLFSAEYFSALQGLLGIADSPFMPKTIADRVNQMQVASLIFDVKPEDMEKYAKVNMIGFANKDGKWGRINNTDLTLFEFLNILEDIKTGTINWIENNSTVNPDLNI